jgi:predicted transcriptional regulator
MTTDENERHERVTFRVRPGFNSLLDETAIHLSMDKSKMIRQALLEFAERQEYRLTPKLARWWRDWRENRKHAGI